MADKTVSQNIRRLRQLRGLTQAYLAEVSGISRAAYRNIETGRSEPRSSTLHSIAAGLKVPIEQLVLPVHELRAVRFRSNKRMRSREQILADAGRWLADFNQLEEILSDRVACSLADIRRIVYERGNGNSETVAEVSREVLGLNREEPVRDICGLLESAGVKVGEQKIASEDFFGLSVAAEDGGPAVIVNTWERISVERWIFTAAHELGHLLLHLSDYDVSRTDEDRAHEKEANSFAGAFLMPDVSFWKEWDETYGQAFVDRVLKVKRIFRVSYRTVLYRLATRDHGAVNIWARFQADYRRRHGRTLLRDDEPEALAADAFRASLPEDSSAGEPDGLSPVDFMHDRLSRLVRRAVEQEEISLGRGAEVLGLSLQDMRDLVASWVS